MEEQKRRINPYIIVAIALVWLLVLLTVTYFGYKEFREAKDYCDSFNGTFGISYKLVGSPFKCNDERLLKFSVTQYGITEQLWLLESESEMLFKSYTVNVTLP